MAGLIKKVRWGIAKPSAFFNWLKSTSRTTLYLLWNDQLIRTSAFLVSGITGWNPYVQYRLYSSSDTIEMTVFSYEMTVNPSDKGLSRDLIALGFRELLPTLAFQNELSRIRSNINGEIKVMEIGANIGYYVLMEAEVLGSACQIAALEPEPTSVEILRENININEVNELVEILPVAVGPEDGTVQLHQHEQRNLSTTLEQSSTQRGTIGSVEVEQISPSSLYEKLGWDPAEVAVVRMDIEGYEYKIVPELMDIFSSPPTLLYMEIHPFYYPNEDVFQNIIGILTQYNFELIHASYGSKNLPIETSSLDDLIEVDTGIELLCLQEDSY